MIKPIFSKLKLEIHTGPGSVIFKYGSQTLFFYTLYKMFKRKVHTSFTISFQIYTKKYMMIGIWLERQYV